MAPRRKPPAHAALPVWPTPRSDLVQDSSALDRCVANLQARSDPAIALVVAPPPGIPEHEFHPRHTPVRWLAIAGPAEEGTNDASAWVVDLEAVDDLTALARWLGGEDGEPPYVVMHDAQRDLTMLARLQVFPVRFGSTLIAATLLAEGADRKHDRRSLDECMADTLEHWLGDEGLIFDQAEPLARGADALVALLRKQTPELRRLALGRVYDMECRLIPAVMDMEDAGMGLDAAGFQRIADGWVRERADATDPDRITRLDKLISTYGHWPREFVDMDGRIRCRLHPMAADSGRFSATEPNLQQVPSQHTAPGLRACFVPVEGSSFVIADYAQIELRVAAHLAPSQELRDVFTAGRDPHRATAATISGKPEAEITAHERKLAKAVNFGFLFGMGPGRFREYAADSYGVELTEEEARRARESFFATFPGLGAWHERVGRLGRDGKDVTVRTAMGRRKRFVPGKFSFNAALNIPVQGTAAEGFKLAMIELYKRLPEIGGRGILCVHDELIVEVPTAQAEAARELVVTIMQDSMATLVPSVPIVVEAHIGSSWAS